MKKILLLMSLTLILSAMAYGAPPYEEKTKSDPVQVVLMDAQPMTVDFVIVSDDAIITNATAAPTEYIFYKAMPAEVYAQVFDLEMPVFRLCLHRKVMLQSNLHNGWRGQNSNPPNQYDRA